MMKLTIITNDLGIILHGSISITQQGSRGGGSKDERGRRVTGKQGREEQFK